jgi:hypothetical protein
MRLTRWAAPAIGVALALLVLVLGPGSAGATRARRDPRTTAGPIARVARVCNDYASQAAAQRAADTRDGDGDGVFCESLPCPCATGAGTTRPSSSSGRTHQTRSATPGHTAGCTSPGGVQNVSFSATKYPHIRAHFLAAVRRGWPGTLVIERAGADARRERLLRSFATRIGFDRDEYPPAVGRGTGAGLTGGEHPRGWKADVSYVPSAENRSHGSTLGIKLRRFCDGTRFRYVFY